MRSTQRAVTIAGVLLAAVAGIAHAQAGEGAAAATGSAPPVQNWGDSVTLRLIGISLRLPADDVRWTPGADGKSLAGVVAGASQVQLTIWESARSASCASWLSRQRGTFERSRRLGLRVPQEDSIVRPAWLPQDSGWSHVVWMGNACRDGVRDALVIGIDQARDIRDSRAVEATRTMLWYLGDAAARAQR